MTKHQETLLVRVTLFFLMLVYVFKLEYWPISYYPVFSQPVVIGKFTSYRMGISYKDGRVLFPLTGSNARRLDVYLEHEFNPQNAASKVGKLNLYAGLSFLRLSYHGRLGELSKLLDGAQSAFVLREVHHNIKGQYQVIEADRLFEIGDNELFDQIL